MIKEIGVKGFGVYATCDHTHHEGCNPECAIRYTGWTDSETICRYFEREGQYRYPCIEVMAHVILSPANPEEFTGHKESIW